MFAMQFSSWSDGIVFYGQLCLNELSFTLFLSVLVMLWVLQGSVVATIKESHGPDCLTRGPGSVPTNPACWCRVWTVQPLTEFCWNLRLSSGSCGSFPDQRWLFPVSDLTLKPVVFSVQECVLLSLKWSLSSLRRTRGLVLVWLSCFCTKSLNSSHCTGLYPHHSNVWVFYPFPLSSRSLICRDKSPVQVSAG